MSELKNVCDQDEKLFLIFKKAVEAEQKPQKTYKEAIDCCTDQVMSKVFQRLHDDEATHETTLKEHYRQLRENGVSI